MFNCLACETMYPDMCDDCLETVLMDCTEDAIQDEDQFNKKINIATGDDFPLELMEKEYV